MASLIHGQEDNEGQEHNLKRMVMWVTKNDERVCPICGQLEGKVFPEGLHPQIPIHTDCRCKVNVIDIDSKYFDGDFIMGDKESISNQLHSLIGTRLPQVENISTMDIRTEGKPEHISLVNDRQRVREQKSLVRMQGITGIMKQWAKFKSSVISVFGLTESTQEMKEIRFGSLGRKLIANRSFLGRKSTPRPHSIKVEESENNPQSEKSQKNVNLLRVGILVELTKYLKTIFGLR